MGKNKTLERVPPNLKKQFLCLVLGHSLLLWRTFNFSSNVEEIWLFFHSLFFFPSLPKTFTMASFSMFLIFSFLFDKILGMKKMV